MPKFYLFSGNLKDIIDAKDYKEAIRKSIKKHIKNPDILVSENLFISEKGSMIEDTEENKESLDRHKKSAIQMSNYDSKFELGIDTDLFISLGAVMELCKEFNY